MFANKLKENEENHKNKTSALENKLENKFKKADLNKILEKELKQKGSELKKEKVQRTTRLQKPLR